MWEGRDRIDIGGPGGDGDGTEDGRAGASEKPPWGGRGQRGVQKAGEEKRSRPRHKYAEN